MADLTLWHWEKYAPSIGANRNLPSPFYLRIKAGIPKARLRQLLDGKATTADEWHAAICDLVEMGEEPLVLDGRPVNGLTEYLAMALEQSGGAILSELIGAIIWHNSVAGAKKNTSSLAFGGAFGMPDASGQTGAVPPGNETSP